MITYNAMDEVMASIPFSAYTLAGWRSKNRIVRRGFDESTGMHYMGTSMLDGPERLSKMHIAYRNKTKNRNRR